jgi:hypothetical protein
MKKRYSVVSIALMCCGISWAQGEKKAPTPDELRKTIEAMKAPKVAWREIAWKKCLLEGLKESRAKKKPVLLWVFIDRPFDDARC